MRYFELLNMESYSTSDTLEMSIRGPTFNVILCSSWLTCIVTIRGSGWRVLAPPSMAIPRVLAVFATLTSVAVGSKSPG